MEDLKSYLSNSINEGFNLGSSCGIGRRSGKPNDSISGVMVPGMSLKNVKTKEDFADVAFKYMTKLEKTYKKNIQEAIDDACEAVEKHVSPIWMGAPDSIEDQFKTKTEAFIQDIKSTIQSISGQPISFKFTNDDHETVCNPTDDHKQFAEKLWNECGLEQDAADGKLIKIYALFRAWEGFRFGLASHSAFEISLDNTISLMIETKR